MLKEESSGEPITRFGGACGLLEVSHDVANGFLHAPHACRLVGSNIRDGASVAWDVLVLSLERTQLSLV